MFWKSFVPAILFLTLPVAALAHDPAAISRDSGAALLRVQTHAGKTDTDGLLSPGELRNPHIDYDFVQRDALRRGDMRFANPYNDAAAAAEREYMRGRYDWERESRERHRYGWEDYDHDRYDHERRDSWWPW